MIHKWSLPGEEGAGRTKHGGSRGKTLQPDKSSLHSTISLNWISFYNLTSRPAKPQNWYYSPCSGQGSAMTMSANGGNHCFVPTLLRWALSGTQRQLPRKTKYTSKIAQTAGQDKWDPVEIHNPFFFPPLQSLNLGHLFMAMETFSLSWLRCISSVNLMVSSTDSPVDVVLDFRLQALATTATPAFSH